jgi:hypothetical protein
VDGYLIAACQCLQQLQHAWTPPSSLLRFLLGTRNFVQSLQTLKVDFKGRGQPGVLVLPRRSTCNTLYKEYNHHVMLIKSYYTCVEACCMSKLKNGALYAGALCEHETPRNTTESSVKRVIFKLVSRYLYLVLQRHHIMHP